MTAWVHIYEMQLLKRALYQNYICMKNIFVFVIRFNVV